MLDAARSAESFIRGRTRADLDADQMLLFALVRALEIIGEAANNVSSEGREQYDTVPWGEIVGLRHRIVHAYYDVNPDRVWAIAVYDVPPLIAALEQIVPPWPGDEPR